MAERTFLPIAFSELPVSKIFVIETEQFLYEFIYNSDFDFITIAIKDQDDEVIHTSKIVFENNVLHAAVPADLGFDSEIVPRDFVNSDTLRVETTNIGDPVKLYVEAQS